MSAPSAARDGATSRALPWLAVGLAALALAVTIAGIVLLTLTWHTPRPEEVAFPSYGVEVAERLQFALVALIGAFIAARRPAHPIGWLMVVGALGFPLQNLAESYARYTLETAPEALPGGMLAAWGTNWLWALTYPLPALLFLLFPTGRAVSPRWRVVVWTTGLLGVLAVLATALLPGPLHDFPDRHNPVGLTALGAVGEPLVLTSIAGLMACFLLGVVSLLVRYRRAGDEERAQVKWLVLAASLFVLFVAGSATGLLRAAGQIVQAIVSIVVGVGLTSAVAVAILRYRLYDIDRIVSRTVAYILVSGVLVIVYVLAVMVTSRLIAPLGADNDFAVAAATLAAAALFRPARRVIQAHVDRRFNRARYDAEREVEVFRAQLRDEVDLDELREAVCVTVAQTVAPAGASLWLRRAGERSRDRAGAVGR